MTLLLGYLLLGLAACAHCQISLVQSGNGNVKPNEVLKLTCKVIGYTITTGYWWSWNRQTTEKGLEWLGLIKSDGAVMYNSAFQSRISVTRDTTNNEYSVQLSNMRSDDSGTYYCARDTVTETTGNL
ncbi:immunoglobulin heavy chain variable region [Pelobates cultripes]|nr:immunoglobulin heavy chain variable region [Pelobates cultripes]